MISSNKLKEWKLEQRDDALHFLFNFEIKSFGHVYAIDIWHLVQDVMPKNESIKCFNCIKMHKKQQSKAGKVFFFQSAATKRM